MQTNSSDPLDWTVDEVVSFLCHNPETPWSYSNSKASRPNPTFFEPALRDNDVTGEVLLRDVNKEALRDDLGLKSLGQRSSMMQAIRFLQQRSQKFQGFKAEDTSLLPSPLEVPPQPPLPPKFTSPRQSPAQHKSLLPSTGASHPGLNESFTMAVTSRRKLDEVETESVDIPAQDRSDADPKGSPQESAAKLDINIIRPHEQIVVDSHGRKRRRLNLGSSVEVQSKVSSENTSDVDTKDWYMGPDDLTVEEVFYASDPEGDDQSFTLLPSILPAAQRAFVNDRLKYFFQQLPIDLSSDQEQTQRAVVPYKASLAKSSNNAFFTLYKAKGGAVSASKERLHDWPYFGNQLKSDEQLKSSDPLSHLLHKYPVEEDAEHAYPLYGDSGSEGEFDEDTWREIEDERSDPTPRNLEPVEVDSVISHCIFEYENQWRETRLPKEEYKARNLWLVARRRRNVNQEIKSMAKDISLLETRLRKLEDKLRENEYTTKEELRTQCQCLEPTVFEIQKQKWRISVLEQQTCPPKVAAPRQPQCPHKPKVEDEESLDTESDFIEEDPLDGFIDDTGAVDLHQIEQPPASSSSSDGDDDIISVSGTRRRTRGRAAPPVFASSSRSPSSSPPRARLFKEKPEVIDLTMEASEPEDLEIETPPLNPVGSAKSKFQDNDVPGIGTSMSPPPSLTSADGSVQVKSENEARSSMPHIDDMDEILSLDWVLLEERKDRRRLLAKIIGTLPDKERNDLSENIPEYQFSRLKNLVRRALQSVFKGFTTITGTDAFENSLIMRTAAMYVSWVNCIRIVSQGIKKHDVASALEDLEDRKSQGFDAYYEELIKRLAACREWRRETDASAPEHDLEPADTPRRKRKREVKESQLAKMNQENAQIRVAKQAKQKRKLAKRLQSMGLSNDNPSHQAVSFKEPVIYLNAHIGQRVKPHQLEGIQFMWRELIEDKNQEGCLLAHTMGLGKTMQVISLLTTIFTAAASSDPKVRQQIPENFRQPQVLILCPSSLIENWHDEFITWSPELAPMVRQVVAADSLRARLDEVSAWYREGGVLLISYNIFQAWIINHESKKRPKPLSDDVHQNVKRWLLEGPSIIIADEAHKMKNPTSKTSVAAMQFHSKSRIALTGSPLANNLRDYYTMVNWISEDYLGTLVEFKASYIEPIEEGLYADSSYGERRKSLMKLQVLKRILEPKINRADITVLEGDLPPKVEFVLTVPLTRLQKAAYDSYAAFVLRGQHGDVEQAQLWSWLGILGLCCNHPACFRDKLVNRAQDASKIARKMGGDNQVIPGDESIEKAQIPDLGTLVAEQQRFFSTVPDLRATELSARAEIASKLIDESIAAGDKVLIFSQSLPTLNYLEDLLKASKRRYSRLDGSTPIGNRQAATKQFNSASDKQVYLISTRAGGLGLNIPGANRVIIFDFSFSPIWEEQAVGRAYRMGQRKPVFVYRFLAGGTFEEIIHDKAIFKTELSVRVVDKKSTVRSARKKPGDYLFPAKEVAQKDISEYIGRDKQVLDKILREDQEKTAEERLIRDIKLTQTFMPDANDKLTEDEQRSVQQEYDDQNLRRTDPEAYQKRLSERQMQLMQQQHAALSSAPFAISVAHGVYQPSRPMNGNGVYPVQQNVQTFIPQSAHNSGPPALAPATIASLPASSHSNANAAFPFLAHMQPPIIGMNKLAQAQDKPQVSFQPLQVEKPIVQTQPNRRPNEVSQRPQAVSAGQGSAPRMGVFNDGPRLQTSSNHRVGSEPLKPNSPNISTPRPETVQQETSLRGQSAPLQLQENSQPENGQETSAEAQLQQPPAAETPKPVLGAEEEQAGNGCKQQ
ncbi:putative SNF2 family helicase/ATPase [Aspergillus undulatus]|uniref:putative SNF2 family helicase/ATPase n=1 Tax=Aspergillus undulatus TaxID=1810928 RepID=UPI003CCDF5EC